MTDESDPLVVKADALETAVTALVENVSVSTEIEKRTSTLERKRTTWLKIIIVGLTLDFCLTVGFGLLYHRVDQEQQRTDTNTQVVAQLQNVVSSDVLCPLYGIFLKAYRPETQKPEDLDVYNEAFAVIRAGNRKLGCPSVTP